MKIPYLGLISFKASKTLSGIETLRSLRVKLILNASKPLKPFQGLKQEYPVSRFWGSNASKPLKPFQGLKPPIPVAAAAPAALQSL